MERREALYMVVRDAMVRAGVLSAGYKFKVLSLDQAGQQFLVMIDLAREYGASTARLSEIEALISQTAKSRFDILVTAVYWRMHDNTAIGVRQRRATDKEQAPAPKPGATRTIRAPIVSNDAYEARVSLRGALTTAPAPLTTTAPTPITTAQTPLSTAPAPLREARPSRSGAKVGGGYDPIEADEVAAFKRALSAAAASSGQRPVSAASRPGTSVRSGPMTQSPLLQPSTGFADTEMSGGPDSASSDLSGTQYGDLH